MALRESLRRSGRRLRNFSSGLASVVSAGIFGFGLAGCSEEEGIPENSYVPPVYSNSIPANTNSVPVTPNPVLRTNYVISADLIEPSDGDTISERVKVRFRVNNVLEGYKYKVIFATDKGINPLDRCNEEEIELKTFVPEDGQGEIFDRQGNLVQRGASHSSEAGARLDSRYSSFVAALIVEREDYSRSDLDAHHNGKIGYSPVILLRQR